jgi:hypothetical protein
MRYRTGLVFKLFVNCPGGRGWMPTAQRCGIRRLRNDVATPHDSEPSWAVTICSLTSENASQPHPSSPPSWRRRQAEDGAAQTFLEDRISCSLYVQSRQSPYEVPAPPPPAAPTASALCGSPSQPTSQPHRRRSPNRRITFACERQR